MKKKNKRKLFWNDFPPFCEFNWHLGYEKVLKICKIKEIDLKSLNAFFFIPYVAKIIARSSEDKETELTSKFVLPQRIHEKNH